MRIVKSNFIFRRLAVLLLVLGLVIGMPMQGTAMASSVPWEAGGETPMTKDCGGCDQNLAPGMVCPTIVCLGFSAVAFEQPKFTPQAARNVWARRHESGIGVARRPDLHPPRIQ